MDYKEAAEKLCDGYLDMPSGCDGCPLSTGEYDGDGNMVCALNTVFDPPPTVDAVPVVRCRECKWFCRWGSCYDKCCKAEGLTEATEDSFCSYGEHRDQSADVPGEESSERD